MICQTDNLNVLAMPLAGYYLKHIIGTCQFTKVIEIHFKVMGLFYYQKLAKSPWGFT